MNKLLVKKPWSKRCDENKFINQNRKSCCAATSLHCPLPSSAKTRGASTLPSRRLSARSPSQSHYTLRVIDAICRGQRELGQMFPHWVTWRTILMPVNFELERNKRISGWQTMISEKTPSYPGKARARSSKPINLNFWQSRPFFAKSQKCDLSLFKASLSNVHISWWPRPYDN